MNDFLRRYNRIRSYTEILCKPLYIEDYVAQPVEYVSPAKWHLAHTTWFFETFLLKPHVSGYVEYHPAYNFLFNSYYNTIGRRTQRANRGDITRPSVEAIYAYRKYVDQAMCEMIQKEPSDEAAQLIELGLQHEQQHQELICTDVKYTLGLNPMFPVYNKEPIHKEKKITTHEFISFQEGTYKVGYTGSGFCFDNERNAHNVYLPPFSIRKELVSNEEYLEFIQDGGYQKFEYWHDEGWKWVTENQIQSPLHWHNIQGEWHEFTLQGLKEMRPQLPVNHVNYYEAAAFAHWKNGRLPTEFEWEAASDSIEWGDRWEWTESAYLPYPGFRKAEGAVGEYNGKFMVNQKVLRGASVATSAGHSRNTYRNFFHPHYRWQYSGIRFVQ